MIISNSRKQITKQSRTADYKMIGFSNCDILASTGREGLYSLLDSDFFRGDILIVALPCFSPQGLVSPFKKAGWRVIYYALEKDFTPNASSLNELISTYKISLVIGIHLLGLELDFKEIKKLCARQYISFLEDYSHLLRVQYFSTLHSKRSERYYDFQLVSLPKLFGVPDGAILNGPLEGTQITLQKYKCRYVCVNRVLNALHFLQLTSGSRILNVLISILNRLFSPYNFLQNTFTSPSKISKWSKDRLEQVDLDSVALIRSKYWNQYCSGLSDGLLGSIDYKHYEGCIPFGFPLVIQNRNSLFAYLKSNGVHATVLINHWDYSQDGQTEKTKKTTTKILNEHIVLPLQEYLLSTQIEYVIELTNNWYSQENQKI